MEIILNEKSLDGQFESLDEFCDTLPTVVRNLKFLRQCGVTLLKRSSFYQCKITSDCTVQDLRNNKGQFPPQIRDKVRKWKSTLFSLTDSPPFWDEAEIGRNPCVWRGNDVRDSSLGEAVRRETALLSFEHDDFRDVVLEIEYDGVVRKVASSVSTEYLAETFYRGGILGIATYVKVRFQTGRINAQLLDDKKGSVEELEKTEVEELLKALERFDLEEDWGKLTNDNFFNYKKYQPSSRDADWFAGSKFRDRQIDKFRCGKHSRLRCFGYREARQFYLLRVERDHSVSDNG